MADIGMVLAIIQSATEVIKLCKYWIEAVHDALSDLRSILIETSTLEAICRNIEFLAQCNDTLSPTLSSLCTPTGALTHCGKILKAIADLLPTGGIQMAQADETQSKSQRSTALMTRLAWPLKKHRAEKLLQDLSRYKAAINLALTTETVQDIRDIKSKATGIFEILTEGQRHQVFSWLQKTDPSPMYHRFRKVVEQGTCDWILRMDQWTKWLARKHRCLWIHGIPGAGKTVLATYLIDETKRYCNDIRRSRCVAVYYYCHFGHNQDEATPFLRWVVSRLCHQAEAIPSEVYTLFKQGCEPSLEEILGALATVVDGFETVYVILDAVDESKPRDDLLKVLRDLATDSRFQKIQLLATSRDYIDIERVLEMVSLDISMSNEFVAEDIRHYIRASLQTNQKFKAWSEQLRNEAEEALCGRAKGMFRWAVCQTDRLQRLKGDVSVIKRVLATLPRTLEETYERIFLEISAEERPLVRECLKWVSYHNDLFDENIPCAILLKALGSRRYESKSFGNDRVFDEETLREMCGCLIQMSRGVGIRDMGSSRNPRYSDILVVSFAHYTVREFLDSEQAANSAVAYFSLQGDKALPDVLDSVFLQVISNYRLRLDCEGDQLVGIMEDLSDETDDEDDKRTNFQANSGDLDEPQLVRTSLWHYCVVAAIFSISRYPYEIADQPELTRLALQTLDFSSGHMRPARCLLRKYQDLSKLFPPYDYYFNFDPFSLRWSEKPCSTITAQAMSLFWLLVWTKENLDLVRRFLENTQYGKEILLLPLKFRIKIDIGDSEVVRWFEVSILEFFTSFSSGYRAHLHLKFLLDQVAWLPDPSTLLLSYIWPHHHHHSCKEFCVLQHLIDEGADPNGNGYCTTPLQIAVILSDYEGVRMLLEAGADPNGLGKKDGIRQEAVFISQLFECLGPHSPLFICRYPDSIIPPGLKEIKHIINIQRIGAKRELPTMMDVLLLEYKARSFSL